MLKTASTALLAAATLAAPAFAWTLDSSASAISYVSIKNGDVAEPNVFSGLSGSVAEDGAAEVAIELSSVETYIDIRNERMREFLFNVADFPVATVSAALDMDDIADLAPGQTMETFFDLSLAANGEEVTYEALAWVTRVGEDTVRVDSKQPIIVYADELGYMAGLNQLREIAGLDSIERVVPVSFSLSFTR